MRLKLFLLLLLTAVIPSLAQTTGVAGTVVDSNTGVPVSGATVMLDNRGLGQRPTLRASSEFPPPKPEMICLSSWPTAIRTSR